MKNTINRRDFLCLGVRSSLILSGTAWVSRRDIPAIEPFKRPGEPRLLLSLAAYSFRNFFIDGNRSRNRPSENQRPIDLFQFIDFCAENQCDGTELTSYYFPANPTSDFLLKLKRHAFLRGIDISGTAVGNTFTLENGEKRDQEIADVKTWIDRAHILGAPHIRVFAGSANNMSPLDAKKRCIAGLEECCEYAGRKGIFLGLENHGGIVAEADEILDIVKSVKSKWLGINLDTGNFHTENPYGDIAKCAPYAVNVQLKSELSPRGGKRQRADFAKMVKILREANYHGYVALEYEASENPWKAVPELLSQMNRAFQS